MNCLTSAVSSLAPMAWPFKDYDFYGERYVNIKDADAEFGERMWYERENIHDGKTATECLLCIEAETEMYTKYAHPKAHASANAQAAIHAEGLAMKEKGTDDYLDYYTFYYGREYVKVYKELYKKYKEEYSKILLSKSYCGDDKICQYHCDSLQYHYEKSERATPGHLKSDPDSDKNGQVSSQRL